MAIIHCGFEMFRTFNIISYITNRWLEFLNFLYELKEYMDH